MVDRLGKLCSTASENGCNTRELEDYCDCPIVKINIRNNSTKSD